MTFTNNICHKSVDFIRKSNEMTILLFLAILAYHCIGEFANVVNSIEKSIFCTFQQTIFFACVYGSFCAIFTKYRSKYDLSWFLILLACHWHADFITWCKNHTFHVFSHKKQVELKQSQKERGGCRPRRVTS